MHLGAVSPEMMIAQEVDRELDATPSGDIGGQ